MLLKNDFQNASHQIKFFEDDFEASIEVYHADLSRQCWTIRKEKNDYLRLYSSLQESFSSLKIPQVPVWIASKSLEKSRAEQQDFIHQIQIYLESIMGNELLLFSKPLQDFLLK